MSVRPRPAAIALAGALLAASLVGAAAAGSQDEPVALTARARAVADLDRRVSVTINVSADPGALDIRTAPLRLRARLARGQECGATFTSSIGTVVIDTPLSPQPAANAAYAASVRGSVRLHSYGVRTICAYLEEEGDERQFATYTDSQIDVSRRCTRGERALARARARSRRLRTLAHRAHGGARSRALTRAARQARSVRRARTQAIRACRTGGS